MKKVLLLLAGSSVLVPVLAHAQQQDPYSSLAVAASVGEYFPADGKIRSAMGDSIFTFGVSLANFAMPKANTFAPNFQIISADKNGSNFLLVPVTLGYQWQFANQKSSTIPYARVDAGLCYFNYSIQTAGPTINGSRVGGTADAQVGVQFARNWRLHAGYYLFTSESGLSFNGLQLGLTFGLFHL